jgi:HrpA-like RNA helicase
VLELQRLISKTDEARGLIQNKDVIFMIGNTGSGKSTNILKFLGYDLKLGKFGKLTTLVPTKDLH